MSVEKKDQITERPKDQQTPQQVKYDFLTKDQQDKIFAMDGTIAKFAPEIIKSYPAVIQTFAIAKGLELLRSQVQSLLPLIKPLIGSPLGFLTDKDMENDPSKLYSDAILVEAVSTALLKGFRVYNNEFNIIAGKFFGAKNGYKRLVHELADISDLNLIPSIPQTMGGGALVEFTATFNWKSEDGKLMAKKLIRKFPVKLYSGQGADVALGKGERRMYAAIHEFCTGTRHTDTEDDEVMQIANPEGVGGALTAGGGTSKAQQMAEDLKKQQSGSANGNSATGVPGVGGTPPPAGSGAPPSSTVLFPEQKEPGTG